MKSTKQRITLCCILFITLLSCTQQTLDFDQFDELKAEPVIEASILYIEVPERVINLTDQTDFFAQDFNFDAFSSDFFAERVIEGTVTYEVENATSKALEVTVEFLDESGAILDSEFFEIGPAPPARTIQRELVYGGTGRSIDIIKNTSSIRVSAVNLGGTATTSPFPNANVTLKSKGEFKLSVI